MFSFSTFERAAAATVVLACAVHLSAGTPARAEDSVGQRFEIRAEDLPEPFATPSASNWPLIVERPDGPVLDVPAGFAVSAFASGLEEPRWLAVAENGDVFVSESTSGRIALLRDADGDGAAEVRSVYLSGLDRPHGLAFHGDSLFIAEVGQIRRVRYVPGELEAHDPIETVTAEGSLGDGRAHWSRNIVFAPDGQHFYVSVGSRSNRDDDPPPSATVQRFAADGSDQTTFASGLRNPVGIAFYPGTDDLYVVVNERDGLGDELVPDYLTRVEDGGFYGWPYAYLGKHLDPLYEAAGQGVLERVLEPDVLFMAHSAPLGLVFYDGTQFPPDYAGDAFVALHGSWNAASPTGYKIVRIPFEDGRPADWYENFAVGFRLEQTSWLDDLLNADSLRDVGRWMKYWFYDDERARIWGRPVGLAIAKDGSLLIADDVSGTVWRIAYEP